MRFRWIRPRHILHIAGPGLCLYGWILLNFFSPTPWDHWLMLIAAPMFWFAGYGAFHTVAHRHGIPVQWNGAIALVPTTLVCGHCGQGQRIDDESQIGPAMAHHTEYECPERDQP